MNVDEFHTLTRALEADLKATGVDDLVQSLVSQLEQLVAQPGNAQFQEQVSQSRANIDRALASAPSNLFTPRWIGLIDEELDVADLLPTNLRDDIEEIFSRNEITPQAALEAIRVLQTRISNYRTALVNANSALGFFSVGTAELDPGEYDLALEIPRSEVHNDLGELGQEFLDMDRMLRPFIELATGSRPPVQVKAIASSDFQAFIELAPEAAALVSLAIDRVLVAYERVLNIRRLRAEMKSTGVEDEDLTAIDARANGFVESEIPQIVHEVMQAAPQFSNGERRNEIEIELTRSVRTIAKKVDHGFRMTVRTEPLPPAVEDPESDEYPPDPTELEIINRQVLDNQVRAKYQELPGEPILELDNPNGGDDAEDSDLT